MNKPMSRWRPPFPSDQFLASIARGLLWATCLVLGIVLFHNVWRVMGCN